MRRPLPPRPPRPPRPPLPPLLGDIFPDMPPGLCRLMGDFFPLVLGEAASGDVGDLSGLTSLLEFSTPPSVPSRFNGTHFGRPPLSLQR